MKLICSFTSHQKPSITNCLSLSELPINKCSISIMVAAGRATGRFISGLELLQRLHKSLIKNDKYPVISQNLHKFFIKKKNTTNQYFKYLNLVLKDTTIISLPPCTIFCIGNFVKPKLICM